MDEAEVTVLQGRRKPQRGRGILPTRAPVGRGM